MSDKPRYESVITPAGVAVWPWLTKADTAHNPTGVYKVDLSLPPELAQDVIAKLEKVRDDFIATLPVAKQQALTPRPVYLDEYTRPEYPEGATEDQRAKIKNEFIPEKTGNILLRWKLKAIVMPKDKEPFEQAPVIVDAATGERITVPVYDGSIIKIKGQVVPYTNAMSAVVGITLRMRSVQVLELVTGSGTGDGAGFWTDFENEG